MRFLRLISILMFAGLAISSARADTFFRGKVEYWDRIANAYMPARGIHVEIEGDWWEPDLDVTTDSNGNYFKQFRNPNWGDFDDIDIEAYAEIPGLIEVKEAWYQLWPYHAISPKRHNIDDGDTCIINMKIGGPQNSAAEAWYKTMAETANSFVVLMEMRAHYQRLRDLGAPASILDDKTVIVPAAGVASYYNHLTENINIVFNGPNTGYVNWTNIEGEGNSGYLGSPSIPRFKETMRHELSHGIHDDMTFAFLIGLNSPSTHSLTGTHHETNRWIAYTEGWAAFLPAATFNQGGQLELSRPPGLNIPDTGDHYAKEGQVAGLFWDIFDPPGFEIMDIPARKTYDGAHDLPNAVIEGQTWNDRISDPNLSKIRNIVGRGMDTIQEFLDEYRAVFPGDLYGIKAIAINRGITWGVPSESAATLSGTPAVSRSGDTVTVSFTAREPNAEDRPFVKISAWHQRGTAVPLLKTEQTLSTGWSGDSRSGSISFPVPSGVGTPELTWLVVNDGMRPTAYRLEIPAATRPPFKFPLNLAILKTVATPLLLSRSRNVEPEPKPSTEELMNVKAMKDAVKAVRAELRAYAERKDDAFQADKLLFKIGKAHGNLQGESAPSDLNFKGPRQGPPGQSRQVPNPQALAARQNLHKWMDQVAGGMASLTPLSAEAKKDILPYRQRLQKHAQDHQGGAGRAAQLSQQLDSALNAARGRSRGIVPERSQQLEGAQLAVQQLKDALKQAAADSELSQTLQRQSAALEAAGK